MKFIALPDPTTMAVSVLLVIALATPYLVVRYLSRRHHSAR